MKKVNLPSGSSQSFLGNWEKYGCSKASSEAIRSSGFSCNNALAIASPSTMSVNRGKLKPNLRGR